MYLLAVPFECSAGQSESLYSQLESTLNGVLVVVEGVLPPASLRLLRRVSSLPPPHSIRISTMAPNLHSFGDRFSKTPSTSSSTSTAFSTEEYGYALPLGRGIEKMPMPEFAMPTTLDVRSPVSPYSLTSAKLTLQPPPRAAQLLPPTPH